MLHTVARLPAAPWPPQGPHHDPGAVARAAIRRLFEDGLIDEHHTTIALLAISLGVRARRAVARLEGAPTA